MSGSGELVVPTCCRDVPRIDKPFQRDTLLTALTLTVQRTAAA